MQLVTSTNGFFNGNGGNGIGAISSPAYGNWPPFQYLLATFIVPLNNNQGDLFPLEKIERSIASIVDLAGGGTEYANGLGYWRNKQQKLVTDNISVIQAVVPYSLDMLMRLNSVAVGLKEDLEQDEIFLMCTPAYSISDFIKPNGHLHLNGSIEHSVAD